MIGHDEWVRRFGADPDIVGQSVGLGPTAYTIVGVMPEGFGFPTYHSFWIPWRLDAAAYAPRSGPSINVFGRLAPGATLESAQAELTAISRRLAAASPATHEHLRPLVMRYAHAFSDMDDPENALAIYAIEIAIVLLLVLICVNVAILVYARTATRQGEIAVRAALGASRRRIVAQLFVEALMLAGVSAAIGIGLTAVGLRQIEGAMLTLVGRWPFWFSLELQTRYRDLRRRADTVRGGHRRRGAGAQGDRPPGPHAAANAFAWQRIAHADGAAVDGADRRTGRGHGRDPADGDVLCVEFPPAPIWRRLRHRRVSQREPVARSHGCTADRGG